MKKILVATCILATAAACNSSEKNNQNHLNNKTMNIETEKTAIEKTLFSYRDALNTSDVNKVLMLYTNNGVFMPSNAPTAIGYEQVKASYAFVFNTIQLNIEFFIDEIVVQDSFAFARTTSKGSTLIHATGETVAEENRELFVLQKTEGQWKIARYMFNKMS